MRLTIDNMKKVDRIIEYYEGKIDLSLRIPKEEYQQRYQNVWDEMETLGIDLGFYFWYREMPGDGHYLTGYTPTLERASGVIAPGKPPLLLVGPESGLLAKEAELDLETRFVEEFTIPGEYYEGVTIESLVEVAREYAGKPIQTVGYMTSYDLIPCEYFDIFTKKLAPEAKVVDATCILEELRYEKSENEFKCMAQADMIASAGVRAVLAVARPGLRELQMAAISDYVVKALGGEAYGCEAIVTSGERCATVIGPATNRIIQEGEIVQASCSPSYQGYKGMCRRTFVMGVRNERQKKYFEIMNRGYELAVAELKNVAQHNLSSSRIDLAAREYFATQEIDGRNMSAYHFFSTAHGTGLTECMEKQLIHPYREIYYGTNIGIMIDLGMYLYPETDICGGCVESAFLKKGTEVICATDVPTDVQELVGRGL